MDIQLLADCPEVIPAIACLHQIEMKLESRADYKRTVKQFQNQLNRDTLPLTLVAFVDTIPIGSVSLVESELPSHAHLSPWVGSLFVASAYQGRGIGHCLMEKITTMGYQMGYRQLHLYTPVPAYFAKSGWTVIDTAQPEEYPKSVEIVVMQKNV
ncbi:MAG: GNAT family N-acetyltransferase [Prochloron sp. SP5CPC1]|nr:GNAT family N-acetyltransferase [Candidatus Paraprochloron terpiosi SP5CPC1]